MFFQLKYKPIYTNEILDLARTLAENINNNYKALKLLKCLSTFRLLFYLFKKSLTFVRLIKTGWKKNHNMKRACKLFFTHENHYSRVTSSTVENFKLL